MGHCLALGPTIIPSIFMILVILFAGASHPHLGITAARIDTEGRSLWDVINVLSLLAYVQTGCSLMITVPRSKLRAGHRADALSVTNPQQQLQLVIGRAIRGFEIPRRKSSISHRGNASRQFIVAEMHIERLVSVALCVRRAVECCARLKSTHSFRRAELSSGRCTGGPSQCVSLAQASQV